MDSRIVYAIIPLLVISTGMVFADEPVITVQTSYNNYDEGDTIVISGEITTMIEGVPVTIQLFTEENVLVQIAQLEVASDGTFSDTIIAEGPLWSNGGIILVRASYEVGGGTSAETEFTYSPKSEKIEIDSNFEVDAGDQGTFDVKYSIKGGTVKDMIVEDEIFTLIVIIEPTDDGSITLDLPREYIGAEKQNGKDDTFIIIIDGMEVPYVESVVLSESRIITIDFEQSDSDIEIIGTYVVPEFGSIVMVILVVGILASIVVTKNKFQMRI